MSEKTVLKLEAVPLVVVCACGWTGSAKEEWHDHRVEEILRAIMSIPAASEKHARKAIRFADESHGAFMMRTA